MSIAKGIKLFGIGSVEENGESGTVKSFTHFLLHSPVLRGIAFKANVSRYGL
jgi:hypothetical protein